MINGEEGREESPRVPSLDVSDRFPHKYGAGDASPDSSLHGSSCGESEFERYCSANSLLGTPSMCSTTGPFHDSVESEFGSFKGGFVSEDATEFENFSLEPSSNLSYLEQRRHQDIRFSDEAAVKSYNNEEIGTDCGSSAGMRLDNVDTMITQGTAKDVNGGLIDDESDSRFGGSGAERENDSSIDEGHSDGDDSVLDDDSGKNSYHPWNVQFKQEPQAQNDNSFFINSSTAFGTNDWDDFELEATHVAGDSLVFSKFEELDEHSIETEGVSSKSFSTALKNIPDVGQSRIEQDQAPKSASRKYARDVDDLKGDIEDKLASADIMEKGEEAKGRTVVGGAEDPSADARTLGSQSLMPDDIVQITPNQLGIEDCSVKALSQSFPPLNKDVHSVQNKEQIGLRDAAMLVDRNTATSDLQDANVFSERYHQSSQCRNTSHLSISESCTLKPSLESECYVKPSSHDSSSVAHAVEAAYTQPNKENIELNDFYDDFVHDMEEILLDSGESSGGRFSKSDKMFQLQLSLPQRDGGHTASTSGTDDASPVTSQRLRVDGVEVIGTKQKKGDVSLSERLVGVKEYTVYIIRVWSGKEKWEVERRYRDFYTLCRRLTSLFADQGWTLPPPWASVERESRKIFGTSPIVVAERSKLIQECLNSVLQSRSLPNSPTVLLSFLSPQNTYASSPGSDSTASLSDSAGINTISGPYSTFGNTISLIVETRTQKSIKQLIESQHYICAGCHNYFDDGSTLVGGFVKALGWGKPRLCEYTGQLFCSSCHTNETAVLPARVLHYWDFNLYPVSQFAKSYLVSIHEQPMLCVGAVNPFLFSKVPALNHVMSIRKRITIMLPFIRCPFRKTINRRLGSRRYLLESTDFFALKDLIDLSKGAFAALPVIVDMVAKKVLEHITEQCLVCCDVGVPCNARQACYDNSSLIFPFQEDEVKRCTSCGSVFHNKCFKRLPNCHCGAQLNADRKSSGGDMKVVSGKRSEPSTSVLPLRFLSGLFPKTNKDKEPVILMGSLPSNDL